MKTQRILLNSFTLVKKPRFVSDDNGSLQGTAFNSGNDGASLSLVPTGRYMVEFSKKIVRYLAFTKDLHVRLFTSYKSIQVLDKYDSGEKN